MTAVHTLHLSPSQALGKGLSWLLRFAGLLILYFLLFAAGGGVVAPYLPANVAEPGPVPQMTGLLMVSTLTVLIVMLMIHSSRWRGWKLMLTMSVAFYLVVTFVMQLETWYFLLGTTVGPALLSRLFLQGIPIAFMFIPMVVLVMGRGRSTNAGMVAHVDEVPRPIKEWIWKLGLLCFAYLVLYFAAGYFIAWQNPDVRTFYGSFGDPLPFLQHMTHVITKDPWLIPFQLLRAMIWIAGAYSILHGSRLPLWQTALIVGLALSVPQNIGHILPNPLIPMASVRLSHLLETASSTFVFGLLVTWLLFPGRLTKMS